ncbi:MAG: choice-of-anchor D domain-containing protein [Myxococcaceae bacterium]|nr:choice-of-anchor D domain-containing protein [Myxococcaceae bacterium]
MFSPRALGSRVLLLPVVLAVVVGGCRCDGEQPTTQLGELNFVFDQGGVIITAAEGDFSFGKVAMGARKTIKVVVQNRGQGDLDLETVEKVDGAPVKLGENGEANPVFTLDFGPRSVPAGGEIELDAHFDAPNESDPSVVTRDWVATVRLRVANATTDSGDFFLRGTAVSGTCVLPETLDFGAVAVNDSFKRSFPIENTSQLPAEALVGPIAAADSRNFVFAAESVEGPVTLETGATRDVVLSFSPTEPREYSAVVNVRAAAQCPDVQVRLTGLGVEQVLTCVPNPLDFGFATPSLTLQDKLVISNTRFEAVTLTGAAPRTGTTPMPASEFKLLGAESFTVPAATRVTQLNGAKVLVPGTLELQLTFSPGSLGTKQANLTAQTPLARQRELRCPLRGAGGGPDIEVSPKPTLNVGRIPYFPGSQAPKPFWVTRKLSVQNVGTLPEPPEPRANLKLGTKDAAGNYVRPYWRITPKNADSTDAEICVGEYDEVRFPFGPCRNDLTNTGAGRYDPAVGIVAKAGMSVLDIPIRVTPNATGKTLEWDVTLLTNDPDEPEVTVTVKAQSVTLPPCQYTVSPASLNFGLVTPPSYRDLTFNIKNVGTQSCLIPYLDLETGSSPIYSLPNGPIEQRDVAPGDTVSVLVRAAPNGVSTTQVEIARGNVVFGISDPLSPEKRVALTTSVATACLTISPAELDFGVVERDCSSNRRTFAVYNTCATPVVVNSWGVAAGAGIPAGSAPTCPGPADCPEFMMDGAPSFSMGTVLNAGAATPATFSLLYHPLDYGADIGAFVLNVTQNGDVVDYLVSLRGRGDTIGFNIDTFRQDPRPKADILLVIDNSCSMADKQSALAQNFRSFISYAAETNVDYQLGVITTDMTALTEGHLIGDAAGLNPKVLKPTTPDLETVFTNRVRVGIGGGIPAGMAQPALKALTAPLITTVNAGFMRPDAVLAIVIVSDAGDQSPAPQTVYESQFRNIKGAQRPQLFSYNQIGPFSMPVNGCTYDMFSDVSKNLYLIARLGGVREEICSPNWATALKNIGKNAFGYRTTFYLTAEPDLTMGRTIVVKIDGVTLPTVSMQGGPVWRYEPVANSIIFEPLFVPEPGKTLTVEYYVSCR